MNAVKLILIIQAWLVLSINISAQNIDLWHDVKLHDTVRYNIEFIGKKGNVVLNDDIGQQFYISNDKKDKWITIEMKNVFGQLRMGNKDYFREDSIGNLYYVDNNQFLKTINFANLEITNYFQNILNHYFDFHILDDGSVLASGMFNDVNKFSSTGVLLFSRSLLNYDGNSMIFTDKDSPSYLLAKYGSSFYLQEFNIADLSKIGDRINLPQSFEISQYHKGRFYDNYNSYIEFINGFKSVDFNLQTIPSNCIIGKDGTIFYFTPNDSIVEYSKNEGQSFDTFHLKHAISHIDSDEKGNIYYRKVTDEINTFPDIFQSKNYGNHITSIDNFERIIYSKSSTYGNYTNLISGLNKEIICNNRKRNLNKNEVTIIDNFDNIYSLPNGNFIVIKNNLTYIADPEFKNLKQSGIPAGNIYISDLLLLSYTNNKIHLSYDFQNIYASYNFNNSGYVIKGITTDLKVFYQRGNYGYIFDLSNQVEVPITYGNGEAYLNDFVVDISNKDIYLLNLKLESGNKYNLYFKRLIDFGNTSMESIVLTDITIDLDFYRSPIRIYLDRNNNLYFFHKKNLFYSRDKGISWQNLSIDSDKLITILNLFQSFDNILYLQTQGLGNLWTNALDIRPKNKIKIKTANDENYDCKYQSLEVGIPNILVLQEDQPIAVTDSNGELLINEYKDSVNISVITNYKTHFACKSHYAVKFDSINEIKNINIPVKVLAECADLSYGISTNILRRCFNTNTYSGYVRNDGSVATEDAKIEIILDPYFELVESTLPIISIQDSLLILDPGILDVAENVFFTLVIKVNCNAALGEEHCIIMKVNNRNDCTVIESRNISTECQKNVGSYDPNDKSIFVSGIKDKEVITKDDKIEYMIRFQNTGTDTAFNIRIEDYINPVFDIKTIKPTVSSHEYTWHIESGRTFVATFDNINLVDSFFNEPLSNGFLKFEITLDSSLKIGDIITNEASIYFDYNDPIITNIAKSVFQLISGVDVKILEPGKLIPYPNPAINFISFAGHMDKNSECDLSIFNIFGDLVHHEKSNTSDLKFNIQELEKGSYIAKLVLHDLSYSCMFLKF